MDVFRERLVCPTCSGLRRELIVAGDINPKVTDWGSEGTDFRGRAMLEMAVRLDLTALNTAGITTFARRAQVGQL